MPVTKENQNETLYERVLAEFQKEGKDASVLEREWFQLQPKLVLCGGGHVAVEIAKIAQILDFHVQVIDDREEFACTENFPDAEEVCCHSFEDLSEVFPKEENVYYVVVTRGHAADQICVEQILKRSYAYLGMIGSKTKVKKTFEILLEKGFSQEQIDRVHAPIGLPIMAQTPEEIAVSIFAEIIACKNSKSNSTMSKELNQSKEAGTLCIITAKSGSSPRCAGSMMLVKEDGGILGSIGGGVLEHEAMAYAKGVTEIVVKEYDLSNRESAELGMICGGSNQVIFIPV